MDPPFNTGRDFAYKPRDGTPEEHAYSDRWPSLDAFIAALRLRVAALRDMLTPDGCMVLHCDPETSHYVKVMLDGVFGRECYANEIIWRYRKWTSVRTRFNAVHDTLFRYVRDAEQEPRWTQLYETLAASTIKAWGSGKRQGKSPTERIRGDEPSLGSPMGDVWDDIGIIGGSAHERTGYPTQKPEALLERIVTACSLPGDVVLDPYCGSGTTLAVAERLGRKWIGIDSSPVAVRVASKRLGVSAQGSLFGDAA